MIPQEKPEAGERRQEIGAVEGNHPDQHGAHRGRKRNLPPDKSAYHEQGPAKAAARDRLIGEELGNAQRQQRGKGPRGATADSVRCQTAAAQT